MPYLAEFLTIAVVHIIALASPGPDFLMTVRNSLVYHRRSTMYASVGLALGILVHVTYSLVGIGLIISQSIVAFSVIKYVGAAYLIYIGYKSLRAKRQEIAQTSVYEKKHLTPSQAIRLGFLTNALNPKATLYFLALFTQVVNPATPVAIQLLYGLFMSATTFLWFAGISYVLSHRQITHRISNIQHKLEKTFGALLVALGIKVALTSSD